jgi:hypothetical protein
MAKVKWFRRPGAGQLNPPPSLILQPRLEEEGKPAFPLPRSAGNLDNLAMLCSLNHSHYGADQILFTTGQRCPPLIVCCRIRLHLTYIYT